MALERPRRVTADKRYDSAVVRHLLGWLGAKQRIARRGKSEIGAGREPMERTLIWLKQNRRLRLRWDLSVAMSEAFYISPLS